MNGARQVSLPVNDAQNHNTRLSSEDNDVRKHIVEEIIRPPNPWSFVAHSWKPHQVLESIEDRIFHIKRNACARFPLQPRSDLIKLATRSRRNS